ncbi:MAG: FAD-dependent oxidoreductase [Chlorobiaceae bacterium]|nr:FAD-dependent oxidoreductase [Chlorobiaceae bacterium]
MHVGIVGGGINGLCCAWIFAQAGHQVTLFERDSIMNATSRASSKLLHGGIRYLENGEFRLVREALRERDAWLEMMPDLVKPLPIIYPKYRSGKRPRWMLGLGFRLYGFLSSGSALPPPKWLGPSGVMEKSPDLRSSELEGGYLYHDVQMDDYHLGKWVARQCLHLGVNIQEYTQVRSVSGDGTVMLDDGSSQRFERLVNVAGPWAEHLLTSSDITPKHQLDLVRGSHLIINRNCLHSLLLEVPYESRIFFVLPWQGKTLIGTTEVRQSLDDEIGCSDKERQYLITAYNSYFTNPINNNEVIDSFAGLRPLLRSAANPGKASREYAIQKNDNLTTVFGGKWTTARALAYKVKHKCLA